MSLNSRLAEDINEFADRYRSYAHKGLMVQLWIPQTEEGGRRVLSTQGSPFVILGSDHLMLYRCACSNYKPSAGAEVNTACPISQVYADMHPASTQQQGCKPPQEFDRAFEAARCGLHSTLLLPIYDADAQDPACVFELAQHETDVDFETCTQILQDICMAAYFWVPQFQTAQPAATCFQPLQPLVTTACIDSSYSACISTDPSPEPGPAQAADGTGYDDGATYAQPLAAPFNGRLQPVVRRCSRVIAEEPDLACFYPIAEDDQDALGAAFAPPSQEEQEHWREEWRQQQQQSGGRPRRRSRRLSLVVTDHWLAAQADAVAAAHILQQPKAAVSSAAAADTYTSVHPGPLTAHLESPLEEGISSSNAQSRSTGSNASNVVSSGQSRFASHAAGGDGDVAQLSASSGRRVQHSMSVPRQQQLWYECTDGAAPAFNNARPSQAAGDLQSGVRLARTVDAQNTYVAQHQAARSERRVSIEQRRGSMSSSAGSLMILPADAQPPALLGGSLSARQARAVQLGALLGVGAAGRVFKGSYAGQPLVVKAVQHRFITADKVAQAAAPLLRVTHPNVVRLQDFICWAPGQAPEASDGHVTAAPKLSAGKLGQLIILRDDSSSGRLTQPSSGGSMVSYAPMAETWLLQDFCDAGTLEQQLLAGDDGTPFLAQDAQQHLRFMLQTLLGVAQGMEELHARDIVHGDLRARNVLLASPCPAAPGTPPGRGSDLDAAPLLVPRVADAGLCRMFQDCLSGSSVSHQAPELLLGRRQSKASDVFAFGVLMWEVAMAAQPWKGLSPAEVMTLVALEGAVLQFRADIPQAYESLAVACWAAPEARPCFSLLVQQLKELIGSNCCDA